MKRRFWNLILALLGLSAMAGCTLSMEDWLEPEPTDEERGVGKPYTIENDYINVTYELNEGVRPITNNVMNYFVKSEDDTILYFMDNVPQDWMPEVGGAVMVAVCDEYPEGYAGKVLKTTKANGMIMLVTSPTDQNHIFKSLKYSMNAYLDEEPPEDYDPDSADTSEVYMDYSLVAEQVPKLYAKQKAPKWADRARARAMRYEQRKKATRGEAQVGSGDSLEEATHYHYEMSNDLNSIFTSYKEHGDIRESDKTFQRQNKIEDKIPQKAKDLLKKLLDHKPFEASVGPSKFSLTPKLKITFDYTSSTLNHAEFDSEREKIIQTRKTTTITSVEADMSVSSDITVSKSATENAMKANLEKKLTDAGGQITDVTQVELFDIKKKVCLVPSIMLFFNMDVSFGLEINATFGGKMKYTSTSITETGWQKLGDADVQKIDITYQSKNPSGRYYDKNAKSTIDATMYGSFYVGAYAQLTTGLSLADVLGADLKMKGSFGFGAYRALGNDADIDDDEHSDHFYNSNSYIEPMLGFKASLDLWISALGFWELARKSWDIIPQTNYFDKTYQMPSFYNKDPKKIPSSINADATEITVINPFPKVTADYTITRAGLKNNSIYSPKLLLYKFTKESTFNQKNFNYKRSRIYHILDPKQGSCKLEINKKYEFEKTLTVTPDNTAFVLVPALYVESTDTYIIYRDQATLVETGEPSIVHHGWYQTKGREATKEECKKMNVSWAFFAENRYQLYEFDYCLKLNKGTKIKEVAFMIELQNQYGERLKQNGKPVPLIVFKKEKLYHTGYYTFNCALASNYKDGDLYAKITPYFVDKNDNMHSLDPITRQLVKGLKDSKSGFPGSKVTAAKQ